MPVTQEIEGSIPFSPAFVLIVKQTSSCYDSAGFGGQARYLFMISQNILQALKIITEKLSDQKINWVLIASANLALQGVDVEPKDIDILTDKEGAILIGQVLREYAIEPVRYMETKRFNGYRGKFEINGAEVEVIGELKNKIPQGDLWTETKSFLEKKWIKYEGLKIPVINLEQEYHAYQKMGKLDKAEKIKKTLQTKIE